MNLSEARAAAVSVIATISRGGSVDAVERTCGAIAKHPLLENPFFLKLCPRVEFEPADTGLVRAMYLPLDYWDLIERGPRKVGPRGGRLVSFENVGRHFDNTSFIPLVANGWIGTTAEQSDVLSLLCGSWLRRGDR